MRSRAQSAQIEQQLRESNQRFALAVRGANEGIWDAQLQDQLWGRPDTKVWFSPRYKELLGYSDEEFPNVLQSWESRLHPEDRERIFKAVAEHMQHRRPYDQEYRLRTKSGEYRWFSSRGHGVWDEHGKLVRIAGSMRDITEIKQYEEKLRESEATWRCWSKMRRISSS